MAATESAAEEQTNIPTMDSLSEMLNGIISRVRFAAKRVSGDDVFKSTLLKIEEEIGELAGEFNLFVDNEIDQYNNLLERYEAQGELLDLSKSITRGAEEERAKHEAQLVEMREGCEQIVKEEQNRAQDAINTAERKSHKWETAYNALNAQNTSLKSENTTLKAELKTLRQMEPEKLKKKLYEEKKKTSELTATVKDLQTKHNAAAREVVSLKGNMADAQARNSILSEEMGVLRRRMDLVDGEHCVHGMKFYSPVNPHFIFYPHIFMFTLSVSLAVANDHDGIRFINNMDFHVMVRNTAGVEITFRLSELGYPMARVPAELMEHWPEGLDDFLYEYHLDQVERVNPLLHERCLWAREIQVEDLDLPAKVRTALVDEGITTLAQLGSTYAHQLEAIKGIGPETITRIRNLVRSLINGWDKEHGTPETDFKPLAERQKDMDRRVAMQTAINLKELNKKTKDVA